MSPREPHTISQIEIFKSLLFLFLYIRSFIFVDATAEVSRINRKEVQTDMTEETGLVKNSRTISDIKMTEETGLVKNSKTKVDPKEPGLRL